MALTDADIFKAKLHGASGAKKDTFITEWNSLEDHEWLFRIHMHISRAASKDVSKEMGLRSYFAPRARLQDDWENVMKSLKLYQDAMKHWPAPAEALIYRLIMQAYPNYYWYFPMFVYLHKFAKYDEQGDFILPVDRTPAFIELMESTVKYFLIKGVVHNSVNAVKDTVFKVCSLIAHSGDYLAEYKNHSNPDLTEFHRRLEQGQYGRYLRTLVLIGASLNPKQSTDEFMSTLMSSPHIEHILPKKWNNYDKWDNDSWAMNLNRLGNLVPLEWDLNISAKNEFFARKKDKYAQSKIQDAVDLLENDEWYPIHAAARDKEIMARLRQFFSP